MQMLVAGRRRFPHSYGVSLVRTWCLCRLEGATVLPSLRTVPCTHGEKAAMADWDMVSTLGV